MKRSSSLAPSSWSTAGSRRRSGKWGLSPFESSAREARFGEALQKASPIPILVDHSCASKEDAALYLERGARALSTKPGRVGLAETRAIAALALQRGARTAVGLYAESALGTLVNLQQPGPMAAEQTFFLTMTEQVATVMPEIRGGRIELLAEPDLAKLVDWDRVEVLAL